MKFGRLHTEYSVSVLRNAEEIQKLREMWERMQSHPNADIDSYLPMVASGGNAVQPHVLAISSNGAIKTLAAGRIEESRLELKLGYKNILRPSFRILSIIYGGILGETSVPALKVLVRALMDELKNGEFEVLFFNELRVDSDLYRMAKTLSNILVRDCFSTKNVHRRTSFFDSYDDFYASRSSNTRNNLRRYSRLMEKEYKEKLSTRCFQKRWDLDRLMNDAEIIARRTYHRGLGVSFVDTPETRGRILCALEKGNYRSFLLYLDDKPIAFWTGQRLGCTFFIETTGYDPNYERSHPGTYLFVSMMKELYKEGVKVIDFGFGDAQYKLNYGGECWQEASIYIFAPSFKAISVNLAGALISNTSKIIKHFLLGPDRVRKIKRWWRNKLITIKDE